MSSLPEHLAANTTLPVPLRRSLSDSKSAVTVSEDAITDGGDSDGDGALDATRDAREIVRRVQCPLCSIPLVTPVTLPCGNTLCRECIPERFVRRNITYPGTEERKEGFSCPFAACGLDHAMDDCSVVVVLKKVMEIVKETAEKCLCSSEAGTALVQLKKKDTWAISEVASPKVAIPWEKEVEGQVLRGGSSEAGAAFVGLEERLSWAISELAIPWEKEVEGQILRGGRIVSTYTMAARGELAYDSEVTYTDVSSAETSTQLDAVVLEHLKEAIRLEVDCQICFSLLYDPLTMTCGHTFCRKCLHQVLGRSNLCPVCRRKQAVPPASMVAQAPPNMLLSKLIAGLCPKDLAARAELDSQEVIPNEDMETPLFICTLSFPAMPTFLHIFEPRYRLMVRRAVQNGDRKFGMLLSNPTREPQGELGRVPFYQYGTLLHIVSMHVMADGRSLIETVGVARFKVIKHGQLDGYSIGKIQHIDDITLSEEETIEARETGSRPPQVTIEARQTGPRPPQVTRSTSASDYFHQALRHQAPPTPPASQPPKVSDLSSLSTRALYELNVAFVKKMRENSAPWLHRSVLQAYGEIPTDMALFPWWFASVLPLDEKEKMRLLATTSVRQRLRITAEWVTILEARTWNESSGCSVL